MAKQSENIEAAVRRLVAEQFGVTEEEALAAATAAQPFELHKQAQAFGQPTPFLTTAPTEAQKVERLAELNEELGVEPGRQLDATELEKLAEANFQAQLEAAGGKKILDISRAFRATRAGAPAVVGLPRTFEEFLRRQPKERFKPRPPVLPTISPQLVTRRVQ